MRDWRLVAAGGWTPDRTSPWTDIHASTPIGDAANTPGGADGRTLPQLGSVAQQSGRWAADNILRELRGEAALPFAYKDKGIMAMIGRNAAVAEVGKKRHQVEGPVAFAAWLGVHAMLLSGAHSKADAFLSWAWDYFDRDHAAIRRGVLDPEADRLGRRRPRIAPPSSSTRPTRHPAAPEEHRCPTTTT